MARCCSLSIWVVLLGLVASSLAADEAKKDVNYTVTTLRGAETPIVFKSLLKKDYPPGCVVTIVELPVSGELSSSRRNPVKVGGNTDGNRFIYKSNVDFPATSKKKGQDLFKYKIDVQGGIFQSGFVLITVNQRNLAIKNYTLTSVDASKPRTIELRVRDGTQLLTLKDAILSSVQVEELPTSGCTLKQFDGTPISQASTKVTDTKLRVIFFPNPNMGNGDSCAFSYSATRRNGITTSPRYVTLNQFSASSFAPRAYQTNTVYNVDFDMTRMIELVGSTRNPKTNLTFIITRLPSIGQVYDAAETTTEGLPTFGFNQSTLPLTIYTGPKTRMVLVYQVNPKLVRKPTSVTLEYIVKDNYKTSAPAIVNISLVKKGSPRCGAVTISPVFWDKPVKEIVLNFTNPNLRKVQKLVLMKAPKKPIGDLLYARTTINRQRKIPLLPGSYFSDSNNRLTYQVRPSMKRVSGNETYSFRVQNFDGMSCLGTVTFIVMQHDAQVLPAKGINVRRELARLDTYTLLPLWGTANKTVSKPSSVIISQGPSFGTLYQITDDAPYEKGRMYRVNLLGLARSYCARHNCEDYRGSRIDAGDKVVRKELWADDGSLESSTRFWILYKAPEALPAGKTLNNFADTFEYHFFNAAGEKSEVQRVSISYRQRKKRVITCRYSANAERNYNFDHQKQTFIKCVISNATDQAVMIPEFDKYRRHGAQVNFRMYQYRKDGNRVYTGDRLSNTTRNNVVGMWLDNKNTVLVVPSARARSQFFVFRAVIYNTSGGNLLSVPPPEMVRVEVVRDNTPPVWVPEEITGRGSLETETASMQVIDITAYDADDDLLQFRLAQGVSKGILYYEEARFGVTTMTIIKTGSILRIPKGSISRATARLYYKADSRAGWTYPQYDNFTLYADDGGGVLSPALFFNITITGDSNAHMVKGKSISVSYGTVAVALVTVIAVVLIALSAILRRKGRNKYMSLPTDTELHQPRPTGV